MLQRADPCDGALARAGRQAAVATQGPAIPFPSHTPPPPMPRGSIAQHSTGCCGRCRWPGPIDPRHSHAAATTPTAARLRPSSSPSSSTTTGTASQLYHIKEGRMVSVPQVKKDEVKAKVEEQLAKVRRGGGMGGMDGCGLVGGVVGGWWCRWMRTRTHMG